MGICFELERFACCDGTTRIRAPRKRRRKSGVKMQQRTSNLLFQYWDGMRRGRIAPYRYEIEPSKIANLLPETFIAETAPGGGYRIRLAGTRICDQFGRELRGCNLLEFWSLPDREGLASALHNVATDGAVAVAWISAAREDGRRAEFEMTLMPLVHTDKTISRILGCLTAIEPPVWLGADALRVFEIRTVDIFWPDGLPQALLRNDHGTPKEPAAAELGGEIISDARRRFRVLQGGLSGNSE